MTLNFKMRRSYGRDRYYPTNAPAQAILKLAGRVCIEDEEIETLRLSGFDIRVTLADLAQTE